MFVSYEVKSVTGFDLVSFSVEVGQDDEDGSRTFVGLEFPAVVAYLHLRSPCFLISPGIAALGSLRTGGFGFVIS